MKRHPTDLRFVAPLAVLSALVLFVGCGSKEPPPRAAAPVVPPDPATAAAPPAPVVAADVARTWTPEALEDLLAPVALYPDPVLSQLLIAATNPQEVLDAGNWLLQNTSLKGGALDDAAASVGFTPPVRALVQFPETVDMMCLALDWTTELGEAFVADQAGVLGAVQRLRKQAVDVGNLQSSAQMKVETAVQEGQQVVVLKPAKPEVVYVPQYDPVAAYAPTTATTTVTEEKSGHSTGTLVTTGLLAFGAGILVNELFDDDGHKNKHKYDYYYPNYGYGGMPYYPPYPYRPSYGGGYYPSHGYNRPPGYNSGFNNSGNIVINTGGNRPGNNYWDRYDRKPGSGGYNRPRPVSSPISAARPNRPELNDLNKRQPRAMPADVKRPSPNATAGNWKGQGGYAGAKPGNSQDAKDRIANAQPGYSNPAKARPATRDMPKAKVPPKVSGSYAGATRDHVKPANAGRPAPITRELPKPQTRDMPKPQTRDMPKPQTRDVPKPQTRDVQRPAPSTRDIHKPNKGASDRGYAMPAPGAKPAPRPQSADRSVAPKPMPTQRPATSGGKGTAMSGAKSGKNDMDARQRGKQSLPQGARSKGAGGGGGGGGGQKKQKR